MEGPEELNGQRQRREKRKIQGDRQDFGPIPIAVAQ